MPKNNPICVFIKLVTGQRSLNPFQLAHLYLTEIRTAQEMEAENRKGRYPGVLGMTVSGLFTTYRAVEKATRKQMVVKRIPFLPESTQSLFRENAFRHKDYVHVTGSNHT